MKKYLLLSAAAIAALLAFYSCNKKVSVETPEESGTISLTINAQTPVETKAVIGAKVGDEYPVTWSATGETFKLIEIADPDAEGNDKYHRYNINEYALSSGNTTASFSVDLTEETTVGKYSYFAISPQAAYSSIEVASYNQFSLVLPTSQTPTATSVDPAAILLLGSVKNLDAQATSSLNMTFNHLTAYGKMTIKNVPAAIKDEGITSVSVSVPAGNSYYYYRTNSYAKAGTSSTQISINTTNLDTDNDFTAWFSCIPNSITNADIVIGITTASDTYTRTIHIPDGKTFNFTQGHVSSFSIDMSTAAATNLSGDYVIASTDGTNHWYIMPPTLTSNLFVGVDSSVEGTTDINENNASTDFASYCQSDYVWRLAKYSGGYSLQNVYTGKYVTWVDGNTAALSDDPVALNVTDKGEGVFEVKESTLARSLQFYYNNGNTRFAFYSSTQKPSYFVKATSYKTVLPIPTITTTPVAGKTITVNWNAVEHADSYIVTCTGQADKPIAFGTNTTSFTVSASGNYTVTVTAVGSGSYVTSWPASKEVSVGSAITFSWSRSSGTDSITNGYTITRTSSKNATDYIQDKSASEGLDIKITKSNNSAIFTSAPTTISLSANVGGGSTKNPLSNNMFACLINSTGADIAGTETIVTTKVEVATGKEYTVTIPNVASAYGIRIYHAKETSYNIRLYSLTVTITSD